MPGPVAVLCNACRCVLGIDGQRIEPEREDESKVASFESNHAAYEAGVSAGWEMEFPQCDRGEVDFNGGETAYCPECQARKHRASTTGHRQRKKELA